MIYIDTNEEVSRNLEEIDFYRFGTRKDMMYIVNGLMSTDRQKKQEAEQATARSKRLDIEPLGPLMENWRTGMTILYSILYNFLRKNNVQL